MAGSDAAAVIVGDRGEGFGSIIWVSASCEEFWLPPTHGKCLTVQKIPDLFEILNLNA